jgi:hypothetical protein
VVIPRRTALLLAGLLTGASLAACGTSSDHAAPVGAAGSASALIIPVVAPTASATAASPSPSAKPSASSAPAAPFSAGNPNGHAAIPADAQPVDTSRPDHVVGNGTPASCTSAAVVTAVAAGGVITFSCGPDPVVITMTATAKLRNASTRVVLDGGGMVTLSGGGARRILYLNTCDQAQGWATSHCQNQQYPQLTVQNLTFANGNSTGESTDGGGGGAIFDRGGRLKVVNSRFVGNRCDSTGPDLGGAAVRALEQWQGMPVYVVGSTFGGAPGAGGVCSNGGALSSIGVSWSVLNCVMTYNSAIGHGANPARSGTPGGGSGGAIYTDGNTYSVTIQGSIIEHNTANEGGGALFYVSNDRTGTLAIRGSTLSANLSKGFWTDGYPGIFFLGSAKPSVSGSTLS